MLPQYIASQIKLVAFLPRALDRWLTLTLNVLLTCCMSTKSPTNMILDRVPLLDGCIRGVKLYSHASGYQTRQLSNFYNIVAVFIIFYVFVCQAGCPKCGGKYPDPRLRTAGSNNGPNSEGSSVKLDPVEVKAFKRSFLNKLGLRRPPSREEVAKANVSVEVIENMKRVYELSILENNRSHELYPELETKQFFSFTGTGKLSKSKTFFRKSF